jgi:hypothetical protein
MALSIKYSEKVPSGMGSMKNMVLGKELDASKTTKTLVI